MLEGPGGVREPGGQGRLGAVLGGLAGSAVTSVKLAGSVPFWWQWHARRDIQRDLNHNKKKKEAPC